MAYAKTVLKAWISEFELGLPLDSKEEDVRAAISAKLIAVGMTDIEQQGLSLGKQVAKLQKIAADGVPLDSKEVGTVEVPEVQDGQEEVGAVGETQVQDSFDKAKSIHPPKDVMDLSEDTTPSQEKGTTDDAFSELKIAPAEERITKHPAKVEDPTEIETATRLLRPKTPGEARACYNPETEDLVIVLRSVKSVRVGIHSMYLQVSKSNMPVGVPKQAVNHLIRKGVVSRYGK